MRSLGEDRPDLSRPALIVTYGNTSRKYRALDRDVVIVGRAPGCEVPLASPEVAPVHCVIARGPSGWRVRDCSGRGATRINGSAVVEAPLKHGDTLQIGSFSFEAHLPERADAAAPSAPAQAAPAPVASVLVLPAPSGDDARRLDIRARELMQFAENLRRTEQEVNARLAQRHEEVTRAEATLRTQRAELVRRMSEAARASQNGRTKADSINRQDADALRLQLSMLRQELAGRDSIIAGLRLRLEEMERASPAREAVEHEHEELGRLRRELSERIAGLEEQRADLEEANREAELLAARERAKIARDRAELDRLFEEFRFDQQRSRRAVGTAGGDDVVEQLTEDAEGSDPAMHPPVRSSGSHPRE